MLFEDDVIKKNSRNNPFKHAKSARKSDNPKPVVNHKWSPKLYRQGDILFRKIEALPKENLKVKQDCVIAEGEESGHFHLLQDGAVFELLDSDQKLFIKSGESTRIIHDEHLPIKLEQGIYEVIRQREYLGEGNGHVIYRQVSD